MRTLARALITSTAMAGMALLSVAAPATAAAMPAHAWPVSAQEPNNMGLPVGFTLVDASNHAEPASLTDGATVELSNPSGGSYGIRPTWRSVRPWAASSWSCRVRRAWVPRRRT